MSVSGDRVVGVMMGTSADGIDVAICRIQTDVQTDSERVDVEHFRSEPIASALRSRILHLAAGRGSVAEVCQANFDVGNAIAGAVQQSLQMFQIVPTSVRLIASHGQTIWHQLDDSGRTLSTLQIGEASCIATACGVPVASDFRVADVAAGGNGAPLAPIFDSVMLRPRSEADGCRALLNIGGISNVSVVAHARETPPIAFDCGPGGCLIDRAASVLFDGATMDRDGAFARSGRVCEPLLATTMLSLPFFQQAPPKSTGRELFSETLFDEWWRIAREQHTLTREDFICTLTELTARAVADSLERFCPATMAPRQLFVAGGGAHNRFLMERLAALLAPRHCSVHSHDELFSGDAKEAALFALLGYRCWHRRPSTAEGAVLGKLQFPPRQ